MEKIYIPNLTDDDLYGVLNLWAGCLTKGIYPPGSLEEAAAHCAFYMRERQSLQPSGIVFTMQEQADAFENERPELAQAYRKFVQALADWCEE